MSYLPPKKWYLYPFRFMAKCQSVDIEKQYELGARMFDIRISFDKKGNPEFRHGSMAFKGDIDETFKFLNDKKVFVRLVLETKTPSILQECRFIQFCHYVEKQFPDITFFCGTRKFDWKRVYEFKIRDINIIQKISSMTGTILDDWWPWLYAKTHNKKNLANYDRNEWLLIDFINIQ